MEPTQTQQDKKVNYAAVVKRAASMASNDVAMAKESQLTVEALSHSTQAPQTAMSVDVKPYVPSYLAALKSYNTPVILEGVPVYNRKKPLTEAMGSSTVSNSMMEPESTASWADDDETFLLAVARSQQAMQVKQQQQGEWEKDSGTDSNRAAARRGGRGGGGGHRRNGWRVVPGEPSGSAKPRRDRRRGNHPGISNPNSGTGSTAGAGSSGGISGGRFDVLSNNKVMRHL